MLDSGTIDIRRARVINNGTCHLSIETARGVLVRIKEAAPGLTTGQIRARVTKLCIKADPHEATKRYEHALEDRRVIATPNVEGTANLTGLNLPPDRVAAITKHINKIARSLRRDGEERTMDQLRADVYLDILLGASITSTSTTGATTGTGKNSGMVDIRVDLDTLTALSDHPGELNGFGPVIADIARQVALDQQDAEWRYTVTDTETGESLHDGITRRRPTVGVRRSVLARNQTCAFPGCRIPAIDSDLDHTKPFAEGGQASPGNLAPLCRFDHRLRHQADWTYQPIPAVSPEGRRQQAGYLWRSRLGHTYTTTQEPP